jgi:geranylgeranyl reductase
MEIYDVIIVGGGPAGLKCAEELSHSGKRVLLLEKTNVLGHKLCAGGFTFKGMEVLPLPDPVIEHRITRAILHAKRHRVITETSVPVVFTIDRKELAAWQKSLLDDTEVEIRMNSQVTGIENNKVKLSDGTEFGFHSLVGAGGYASVVRKHLNLPVRKKLIAYQYSLPRPDVKPELEVFLDSRRFGSWYAWVFPHRNRISVGCCCDPALADHKKILGNFHDWLRDHNIDTGEASLESSPISFDFRGIRFGSVYLAGEAAGLASGLTGEGIYQSLVSGREVARMIKDPEYISGPMEEVLRYNRNLDRLLMLFRCAGPFRGVLHRFLVGSMNRKRFRDRINAVFS